MLSREYDYLAFGGPFGPGTSTTVSQRYTYTGREDNPVSALMYYRYRQYDPRVGRFATRDPLLDMAAAYSYVREKPVRLVDPLGMRFEDIVKTFTQIHEEDWSDWMTRFLLRTKLTIGRIGQWDGSCRCRIGFVYAEVVTETQVQEKRVEKTTFEETWGYDEDVRIELEKWRRELDPPLDPTAGTGGMPGDYFSADGTGWHDFPPPDRTAERVAELVRGGLGTATAEYAMRLKKQRITRETGVWRRSRTREYLDPSTIAVDWGQWFPSTKEACPAGWLDTEYPVGPGAAPWQPLSPASYIPDPAKETKVNEF